MVRGKARKRNPGEMNGLELAYSEELEARLRSGEIVLWKFEGVKLRLAKNTFYTPDFMVVNADGHVEFHETKGFWRDDARVKLKVAAEQFPFAFAAITRRPKRDGGGWKREDF